MELTPKDQRLLKSSIYHSIKDVKNKLVKFENITDKDCYAYEQQQELNNTLRRYNNLLANIIANEKIELNKG